MSLRRLQTIVKRLRAKRGGCPWDRRQTHQSLKAGLLEETYEVLDAIDRHDPKALREELGDLLLQIVFHADIEENAGRFTLEDVIREHCEKLVRRHPHVFARGRKVNAGGALKQWELIKRTEKPAGASGLGTVPKALPALYRAARIQAKASRLGFEWRRRSQAIAKFDEELGEFRTAVRRGRRREITHELGDLLFALAKVARFLDLDPETTLQAANRRFIDRFGKLERTVAKSGRRMHEVKPEELYRLWRKQRP
ncbi:MAG: nucleoside triphosphate pyrophosphohydrolase [Candidatus Coatesbacteria bacterium]